MTLEEFLSENNIKPKELIQLGEGENGIAWKSNHNVLKQTTSETEYAFAKKQLKGKWPNFAPIYSIYKNEEYYFYISKYLETSSEIEDLYFNVETIISCQGLCMMEIHAFDMEEYIFESEETEAFYNRLLEIVRDYKRIGASDIKPDNMGYNENGVVLAFDIDLNPNDKQRLRMGPDFHREIFFDNK